MAVEHSIKELKGRRTSRKQSGSRRPAVPSSLFTNTSNLRRALTDRFNAAVGTTWKAPTVGSDVSVLSCGEGGGGTFGGGPAHGFLSHSCVVLYLCSMCFSPSGSLMDLSLPQIHLIHRVDLQKDVFNPEKFAKFHYKWAHSEDKWSNGLWKSHRAGGWSCRNNSCCCWRDKCCCCYCRGFILIVF